MPRTVRLWNTPDLSVVDVRNIYFAFASGRLSYDCVTCGAKCCRGFGFIASAGPKLDLQFKARRALPLFVSQPHENSGRYVVSNLAPGCFFLSDDGLCDIHARHGYDAKPETCRLFPFNIFRRAGDFLIVMPHSSLCPLAVQDSGATSSHSDYGALTEGLTSQGLVAHVPECVPEQREISRVIALERAVVAAGEAHMERADYFAFVREQIRLHAEILDERAAVANAAEEYVAQLCGDIVDVPVNGGFVPDRNVVTTMIASTPFLRAQYVFRDSRKLNTSVWLELPDVPLAMTCLYILAEAAKSAGMTRVTFQTVSKLEQQFRPLIVLIATAHAVLEWREGGAIDLSAIPEPELRASVMRVARALLPETQRRRRARLGDILRAHMPAAPLARVTFAKEVARHLAGRLMTLGNARSLRSSPGTARDRIGGAVQRWIFAHSPETVLQQAYIRLSGRAPPRLSANLPEGHSSVSSEDAHQGVLS